MFSFKQLRIVSIVNSKKPFKPDAFKGHKRLPLYTITYYIPFLLFILLSSGFINSIAAGSFREHTEFRKKIAVIELT